MPGLNTWPAEATGNRDNNARLWKVVLGGVAVGDDPAADVQAKRRRMKMSALVDLYEPEGCYIQRGKRQGFPMTDRSKRYLIARLRHHVVPLACSVE